jgi:S1-C subfamily serine protease
VGLLANTFGVAGLQLKASRSRRNVVLSTLNFLPAKQLGFLRRNCFSECMALFSARSLGLVLSAPALALSLSLADAAEPESSASPATSPGLSLQVEPPSSTAAAVTAPSIPRESPSSSVESSVVKIFSTARYPDFYKPWTKMPPYEISGSGVVIEGKRILTNAHVVLHVSQVEVQPDQGGDKISATVESIAPGIDLAVLKLDDEKFFDSHRALPRAQKLPQVRDGVTVYGYPTGGTTLSVTRGIVSRIEFTPYNYPVSGLRIQIDAAINPGNSGGPAVVGDQMIGLAFSHLGGTENIGYIIPCEEIELFLKDVADGHYDGKAAMYDHLQTLENPALRSFLKLDYSIQGIVVHQPTRNDASYPLKEWDVISKIADTRVDDQGMIPLGPNLRVRFQYLVQSIARSGMVPLTVVRGGKEKRIDLPVPPDLPLVMPEEKAGYPPYFILGPTVFSEATAALVSGLARVNRGADWLLGLSYAGSPLVTRYGDKSAFPGERIVFVSSPFFPHKLAKGYSSPSPQVVKSINGHDVKNLANLVEILRDSKDDFITIEFNRRGGGETLVFPRKEMIAATEDILNDNGVRSQGSADMLAIWGSKPK